MATTRGRRAKRYPPSARARTVIAFKLDTPRAVIALGALLVLLLASTSHASGQGLTAQVQPAAESPFGSRAQDWITLGHLVPFGAAQVAVSPDWPTDRTLMAIRSGGAFNSASLVRSTDGGEHWQVAGQLPPASTTELVLAGPSDRRVLFAETSKGLFRSTDAGDTWTQALPSANPDASNIIAWSPDFSHDGLMVALIEGVLWRSRDFGATWEQLHPGLGQVVQTVVFSPDFPQDHLLFVAVAGDVFSYVYSQPSHPMADHDHSLGVLASSDSGDSWSEQNAGLEIDGEPYLAVQTLAISPTFATDGTLFAIAWGPTSDTQFNAAPATQQARGLFVSRDRGGSWALLQSMSPAAWASREVITPSPTFATDEVALWASSTTGLSPSAATCGVARTADGGASWSNVLPTETYDGCTAGPAMFHVGGNTLAVVDKKQTRRWSSDGGQTWSASQVSAAGSQLPVVVTLANGDQALFAPTGLPPGVVGLNTMTTATSGSLPCQQSVDTQLGFDRTYQAHPETADTLGCPTAPAVDVRIRLATRTVGNQVQQSYVVLSDPAVYFITEPNGNGVVAGNTSNERGWPYLGGEPLERVVQDFADGEQTVDGGMQRFENGAMLRIPGDSGQAGQIVVLGLGGLGRWWVYSDTPSAP